MTEDELRAKFERDMSKLIDDHAFEFDKAAARLRERFEADLAELQTELQVEIECP